jgi:inner membrane protein
VYRPGHVGASLLAYAPVAFVVVALGFESLALVGGVAAAGLATLPDVDLRVPLVTHRGPTHTVWFALAVGVGCGGVGALVGSSGGVADAVGLSALGFAVGCVAVGSHVAADALTPAGVRPFAPVREDSYSLDVARASNPVANYGLLVLGVVAALAAVRAGVVVADVAG